MRFSPIFWLIVTTTLIRVVFAATTGLGVDESYMVTAGRVLSLGYFDHPPASWWLSWGAAHLFGTELPIAVRLPFIILFALSQLLLYRIGCIIANHQAGFYAAFAVNLSPVFGVTTGSWVLPDGPLDAALLGAVLGLLHALPAQGRRAFGWWTMAGVCAGLALFSKYSAILIMAGAVLYLVITPVHRRWLVRPQPYLAGIVALLVFSPVLIWNATHGWASLAFQADRAAGFRLRPFMPIQTLAGEALFVLPWLWVPMMMLLVRGFRHDAPWSNRLLVCLATPPIIGFAVISSWSSQRILYHWAAPGYLMLFPLLGNAIAQRIDQRWVRRLLTGSATLILLSLTVVVCQLQFDWLGNILPIVLRRDPSEEGLDWTSVRNDLLARGLLPNRTTVAAFNWRDAGKIGYALGPGATMLCLSSDARQFGFAHPPRDYAGQDVTLLVVDPAARGLELAKTWFQTVDVLPASSVRLDGRVLQTITVLRGHGLRWQP
jgi:hypothetical protein